MWAATSSMTDEDVKRWGRWNSDAYKLYIHVQEVTMARATKEASVNAPNFELH